LKKFVFVGVVNIFIFKYTQRCNTFGTSTYFDAIFNTERVWAGGNVSTSSKHAWFAYWTKYNSSKAQRVLDYASTQRTGQGLELAMPWYLK